jgi:hypothetical protein
MPTKERKARKSKQAKDALLNPIDLANIGTKDDPCFGKLWDLKNDICKRCGDSELCGIAYSQSLNQKRLAIEKERVFKDIEDIKVTIKIEDLKEVLVIRLRDEGGKMSLDSVRDYLNYYYKSSKKSEEWLKLIKKLKPKVRVIKKEGTSKITIKLKKDE